MLNLLSHNKKHRFTHQPPRPLVVVTRTSRRARYDRSRRLLELTETATRVELSLPSFVAGARAWLVEKVSLFKIGYTFTATAAGALWGMGGLA